MLRVLDILREHASTGVRRHGGRSTGRKYRIFECLVSATVALWGMTANQSWSVSPQDAPHFPGERLFPSQAAGPTDLVRLLYGNRLTTNDPNSCDTPPCKVRSVAYQVFNDEHGVQHAVLVAVTDPVNSSHASSSIIGMAWLTHSKGEWALDFGSPNVVKTVLGPKVTIIDGGIWGKAVTVTSSYMGQGDYSERWQLFVPEKERGRFSPGLELATVGDSSGRCVDDATIARCVAGDHKTKVNLSTGPDGVTVIAVTSYPEVLHKKRKTETYRITADTVLNGTAPIISRSTNASAATVAADPNSASYQQGLAARDAWETWFNGLIGSMRNGADYWTAQRSLKVPVPCSANASKGDDWLAGCTEAKRRLTPIDIGRKTDPQYWNGWNRIGPANLAAGGQGYVLNGGNQTASTNENIPSERARKFNYCLAYLSTVRSILGGDGASEPHKEFVERVAKEMEWFSEFGSKDVLTITDSVQRSILSDGYNDAIQEGLILLIARREGMPLPVLPATIDSKSQDCLDFFHK